MTTSLSDGVYLGLAEEHYFAQPRLGSTDLVLLHKDPASWWYGSRYNPDRPVRDPTPEMEFGKALHALVLEGEEAYDERSAVSPYDDFRTKESRIWRDEQVINGRIVMTADMDLRVRHMSALILNHPELGAALKAGMSEVSVLFTMPSGVQMRARFDKMLPRFTVDLKSFGGDARGDTIRQQCTGLIATRDYDVQRYIYDVARRAMSGLIAAGAIYGGTDEEKAWVTKAAAIEAFQWCWIFYRRRDDARPYAPVVKPIVRPPEDFTYMTGHKKASVALANYQAFIERFGFEVPWAVIESTEEPSDTDFPPWLDRAFSPVEFPQPETEAAE